MNAIELDLSKEKTEKVLHTMMNNGLLAKNTHGNIIRFSPPLTIKESDIDTALEIIKKSLL